MGSVCGRGGSGGSEAEEKEMGRLNGFKSRAPSTRFSLIHCFLGHYVWFGSSADEK